MAELPATIVVELESFLRSRSTGSFTIHVKRGEIEAWEAKRTGRIDLEAKTTGALQRARING